MIFFIIRQIIHNKSLVRSLMNLEITKHSLEGRVLDVGGGSNPSYYNFFRKKNNVEIIGLDMIHDGVYNDKSIKIDFETSTLPLDGNSVDQVLLFNILEHIYNYNFLIGEVYRILKKSGNMIGFVPFLVNYHPDPNDYFRYTKESLEKIFINHGFINIEIKSMGFGPWSAAYNLIYSTVPKYARVVIFIICYFLDWIISKLRPVLKSRYPVGYFFVAHK